MLDNEYGLLNYHKEWDKNLALAVHELTMLSLGMHESINSFPWGLFGSNYKNTYKKLNKEIRIGIAKEFNLDVSIVKDIDNEVPLDQYHTSIIGATDGLSDVSD